MLIHTDTTKNFHHIASFIYAQGMLNTGGSSRKIVRTVFPDNFG